MDGNGRWAQRRGRPRVFGHIRGTGRVKPIVLEADRLGVKALTLYAFSTENWGRPANELSVLWRLLKKYLIRERAELHRRNVQFNVIGELDRLAPDVRAVIRETVEMLSRNTGLKLTFAVNYGGRREIARAARLFAKDCVEGAARADEMNEEFFAKYLTTSFLGELSDVDLLIRTSGEMRISNFLLWQLAYSELVFTDLCWPEFKPESLRQAIEDYSSRERRFGGVPVAAAPMDARHV